MSSKLHSFYSFFVGLFYSSVVLATATTNSVNLIPVAERVFCLKPLTQIYCVTINSYFSEFASCNERFICLTIVPFNGNWRLSLGNNSLPVVSLAAVFWAVTQRSPQKKRLLTSELHSFLIVLVVCLRSFEQTNHVKMGLTDLRGSRCVRCVDKSLFFLLYKRFFPLDQNVMRPLCLMVFVLIVRGNSQIY